MQNFNYLHRRGFCKKAKETLIIGKFVQSFQAPLCKGSSAAGGEGLFFYNPPRRRLQVCFAHSQIPVQTKLKNKTEVISHLCFFINLRLCRTFSLRSSLLSLISAQRSVPRQSIMQISPPLPSFTILPSVSESFALASSGIWESFVCSPSFTSS